VFCLYRLQLTLIQIEHKPWIDMHGVVSLRISRRDRCMLNDFVVRTSIDLSTMWMAFASLQTKTASFSPIHQLNLLMSCIYLVHIQLAV
jgi:hypothetical protein